MPASHRPLPTVPALRRTSRPLPSIPRALSCRTCKSCITSYNALLPLSDIPPESPGFRGFSGKASLFTDTYNVTLSTPKVELMGTGAHLLAEITCSKCTRYLGYKIVRAFERSESWKDSRFLLELAELENPWDTSDSEDSS
ncbi:hypothetical protein C8R46DRAFT_1054036 [Mycena filopes]|nr:hypothetical protein C8R46DRAFT_1054036 [Mycena filopes]